MSTIYKIVAGDTFESIARKQYGDELQAIQVRMANPGLKEPLTAGVSITTPSLPSAPQDAPQAAPAADLNEVSISIDGARFRFWESMRIIRAVDVMDRIEMSGPFESEAAGFKEMFVPFSFKNLSVTVGGEPLFSGTMVSVSPTLTNDLKKINIGGYSLPGVLNDCTPPESAYPVEFNGQGLKEIAETIAKPFGITVKFEGDPGAIFERVAAPPGKKALVFLIELAKQRNFIIGSSPDGELLIHRGLDGGVPVANLEQGASPVESVLPFFSPQDYYSHITGLESIVIGTEGSQFTAKNSLLEGVLRPLTFKAPDTLGADIQGAVDAKAARMFGDMLSYEVKVNTWRDPSGALWAPNTIVNLKAPDAMAYDAYSFLIRMVSFERNPFSESATLNLVIPGSFSGKVPTRLPWDSGAPVLTGGLVP